MYFLRPSSLSTKTSPFWTSIAQTAFLILLFNPFAEGQATIAVPNKLTSGKDFFKLHQA